MGLYRVLLTTVSGRAVTVSIYAESLDDLYIKVKADYPELRIIGPDAIRRTARFAWPLRGAT